VVADQRTANGAAPASARMRSSVRARRGSRLCARAAGARLSRRRDRRACGLADTSLRLPSTPVVRADRLRADAKPAPPASAAIHGGRCRLGQVGVDLIVAETITAIANPSRARDSTRAAPSTGIP
jgi:hypothetical protein